MKKTKSAIEKSLRIDELKKEIIILKKEIESTEKSFQRDALMWAKKRDILSMVADKRFVALDIDLKNEGDRCYVNMVMLRVKETK